MDYKNVKRKHIDGFLVVCATPKETGLPYDILMDSLGSEKETKEYPKLGVVIQDMVVPAILSGTTFKDSEKILEWVKKNHVLLLKHWNKELSDLEVLEELVKTKENIRRSRRLSYECI